MIASSYSSLADDNGKGYARWGWDSLWVRNHGARSGSGVTLSAPAEPLVALGVSASEVLVGWNSNTTARAAKYGGVHLTMNGVSCAAVLELFAEAWTG